MKTELVKRTDKFGFLVCFDKHVPTENVVSMHN